MPGKIERTGGKKAEKDAAPAGRNVDKEPPTGAPAGDGLERVRADTLDSLLASGSDLLVASGRLGIRAAELDALHAALAHCVNRWRQESRDLRHALQRAGQGVAEPRILGLEEDLHHLERDSARLAAAARADGRVLTRSVDEVLGHARRIRMRPVAEAWETLPRTVRDLSSAAGKEVILQLSGGEVEADRAVLDGLREALIQLVRNAVDHGIEPPERRTAAGKPRKGTLRVGAELRGDRLIVTVADDGAGLDAGAVRAELERRGISPPSDDADLIQALADARVSTRAEATALSGRGVGLDVVRAAAARIGGRLEARWAQGRGTTFTLECPVTLASARALLVSVASQFVAIPVTAVQRAQRIPRSELRSLEGRTVVQTPEGPLPLIPLGRILAPLGERPWGEFVPVVVLRVGARRLAVSVDELLEVRDLAIRPVRAGRAPLPALRGAALLETGRIALVVEPAELVATGLRPDLAPGVAAAEARTAGPVRRVLVVDDSITTRTLERSILEAAGYAVTTAVDGSDAWRLLQEHACDLVVADVEMPRMDGFTLCQTIRASRRFAELPVVLVTALEKPEDRARGLEAGADAYLGKSSFDQQNLLETIQQLLA